MDIQKRSKKAQEKFADHLMTVAANLIVATLFSILIVPLGAFIQSYMSGGEHPVSWSAIYSGFKHFNVIIFGALYLAPLAAAAYSRSIALRIYDGLSTQEPETIREKLRRMRN